MQIRTVMHITDLKQKYGFPLRIDANDCPAGFHIECAGAAGVLWASLALSSP